MTRVCINTGSHHKNVRRSCEQVNRSGLCELLYKDKSKGEKETVISGMKVPFVETGGIGYVGGKMSLVLNSLNLKCW